MGHPALDGDAHVLDLLEDVGVVRLGVDRLGQVLADLVLVDVEGGHELDVADVIAAEVDVHQARDEVVLLGVLVVVAALDEAARAVADADDGDPDLAVAAAPGAGPRVGRCDAVARPCRSCRWLPRCSPFSVSGSVSGVGRLGLAADMEDPLDDCDDRADEDDAEGELDGRVPMLVPVRTMPSEMITRRISRGMMPTAARPMPEE